jgi:glycosyltransferase involved in cell wall biosynthesis
MQEVASYEAALMGRFPEPDYPALDGEMKGLQTISIPDSGSVSFLEKAAMQTLKSMAPDVDVLQLSHLSRHTIGYGLIFKRYNPKGQLYLKLDAYNDHLAHRKRFARSPLKNSVLTNLSKRFFKAVDLISIENKAGYDLSLRTYPEWDGKLIYLPVGANDRYLDRHFRPPAPARKVILSVGRVGSPEKNYELLLRALPMLKLEGWEMKIAGPISPEFQKLWERESANFPDQIAKITFLGNISNRDELYRLYEEASIFFLPSRVESFGISFVEALYFGNLVVGHPGMFAFPDISLNGRYGEVFEDNNPVSFANAIHLAMERATTERGLREEIRQHAKAHFSWSGIAAKLASALNERKKSRDAAASNA